MISHKHKCIMIHIPKTGGCSMELALGGNLGIMENQKVDMEKTSRKDWRDQHYGFYTNRGKKVADMHLTAHQYKNHYPGNSPIYDDYYKFAFVRNPFDRMVSAWRSDVAVAQVSANWSFKQFLSNLKTHPRFASTRLNMVNYVLDPGENLIVDFIGRYENINSDWEKVAESLGSKILLPKVNTTSTHRKPYQEEYDNTSRQIVEELYKKDLEYFNYKF